MSKFVETQVTTTKRINKTIDGFLENFGYISIVPSEDMTSTDLVIGAEYENAAACHFCKKELRDLISVLEEIYEAMN